MSKSVFLVKQMVNPAPYEYDEEIVAAYRSRKRAVKDLEDDGFILGIPNAVPLSEYLSEYRDYRLREDRYNLFTHFDSNGCANTHIEAWIEELELR